MRLSSFSGPMLGISKIMSIRYLAPTRARTTLLPRDRKLDALGMACPDPP
jgi:hypothetical protein